jgi:hypothetical protein
MTKDEFELRGRLATLLCWHRLTKAEEEDLLSFAAAQPKQEPPPWWAAVEKIIEEYGLQAIDFAADFKEAMKDARQEPVSLRRGDILRCIETDELCTVWATSTTGKTLVKWSANNFGNYTAEQIGELFWLEPAPVQPDEVGHNDWGFPIAAPEQKLMHPAINKMYEDYFVQKKHLDKCFRESSAAQRKPLTDEEIYAMCTDFHSWSEWDGAEYQKGWLNLCRAIEAAHGIKETTK